MRIDAVRLRVVALLAVLQAAGLARAGDLSPAAACCESGDRILGQPKADYQARRQTLMRKVREAEEKSLAKLKEAMKHAPPPHRVGPMQIDPVIVLVGQDEPALGGGEGKFRQKNDFAYLTGVNVPSAALILRPRDDRATLYLPPLHPGARGLEEPLDGPGASSAAKYGFDRVESTETFLADLFRAIGDPRKPTPGRSRVPVVYTITPAGLRDLLDSDAKFVRFLREGAPTTEVEPLSPMLGEMRKAKTCAELDLLRKAIAITGAAQAEVTGSIHPGVYEYELEAKIVATFLREGAERTGFPSIVGSGPNSTIPHYFANRRKLEDGDLVVVDIGAEYQLYTADITRTYPANGKFTARQREIYQLVLDAQKAAEAKVKPGETRLREMTGWTREFLKNSSLRAKDRDGEEHTMDHFFIHGLGHYLGLDVHDVGDTSKPLQPGEVFTIEPGIYIPAENLGVRIEDDYLVTEHGLEKLSKDIPSDPDEIEKGIAQARSGPYPADREK